ncbi:DUF2130 domain-containing protein [Telmatocola sphagniphila]|uniref:DUF2130 domain-containing protein n=1 Tax=Telmatocola sphagniphila TaxID=1123043 RepID=A0A8E6B268_9BACT|nr:DUF2130 domain-containing protein [Telmatocola sphagniphila]QVL29889.1 DUF2130 domain-containing protein [Telmatocola sphagniphila]
MNEPEIKCPNCNNSFKLNESLAAPLVESTRLKYEQERQKREKEYQVKEERLRKERDELLKLQSGIDDEVAERLKKEKTRISEEEAKRLKRLFEDDLEKKNKALKDIEELLNDREKKLKEAQKEQAEVLRLKRELADEKTAMELTIQKKINESLSEARALAKKEAIDEIHLKVREKDLLIAQMQEQIVALQQKAEQGSQQLQGEVLELEMEAELRSKFPMDTITEVKKGVAGADILQTVNGQLGSPCGSILWETKRTKVWQNNWLPKLRDDQREAKADLTILVSQVLPKGTEHFELIDGVWVTSFRSAFPVAMALRQFLMELSNARQAGQGQQTKMHLAYQYLVGPGFRQRIQAIVEKFSDLQKDLQSEKVYMNKQWAKREKQLQTVLESTAGLFGDFQGILGKSLQEIEGLDAPMLEFSEK